jgi:hypothetical protein
MCGFVTLPVWADLIPENITFLQKESQEKVDCYKMHLLTCLKKDVESRRALLEKIGGFVVLMDIMRAELDNINEVIRAPYFRYCVPSNSARQLADVPYPFGQVPLDTAIYMITPSARMQGIMKNNVIPGIMPVEIDFRHPDIVQHINENPDLRKMIESLRMMYLVAKYNHNLLPLPVFTGVDGLQYCPQDIPIRSADNSPNLDYFKQWDQNIKNELLWITRENHVFDTLVELSSDDGDILRALLQIVEGKLEKNPPLMKNNFDIQDSVNFLRCRANSRSTRATRAQ